MENLSEALIAYTGCHTEPLNNGGYRLHVIHNERQKTRNIRTDGHDLSPILSTTDENRVRTFYLHDNGSGMIQQLANVPVVFSVVAKLNDGIMGDYEHWTMDGVLHRNNGPAYTADYSSITTKVNSLMNMYFENGVRKRTGAPSLELYQDFIPGESKSGHPIMRFRKAIFECTYCPEEGDSTETLVWPFVHRLTLSHGQRLMAEKDGILETREFAAKTAAATWQLHAGLGSGIYPTRMEMNNFHEIWDGNDLKTRKVKSVRSWWIRINDEDKREMLPSTLSNSGLHSPKFDQSFRETIDRVGFTERPFFDDPVIELGVLTDLPKFLGED